MVARACWLLLRTKGFRSQDAASSSKRFPGLMRLGRRDMMVALGLKSGGYALVVAR